MTYTVSPNSELARDEEKIRAAAAKCETVQELSRHFGWHIGTAAAANEGFNLGLKYIRRSDKSGPRQAVACPKPSARTGKPKKGDANG